MNKVKANLLFYLLTMLLSVFLITSLSFAWVNPNASGDSSQTELDVALLNASGERMTGPLIDEGNVYPGWSDTYPVRVKNYGKAARYQLGIDFSYNPSGSMPQLANVMRLELIKDGTVTEYRMSDLVDKPLTEICQINSGRVHNMELVLYMDEEAGNEYEGLTLDFDLTLYAESLNPETQQPTRIMEEQQ
jgi:hypothetical protein